MLSRGKLVQDWRRRLAAAEADGAEGERRTWLAQMRLRLYRFLLSCYGDTAWRADEPSEFGDETLADVHRGDTTTLLDCPLHGKPAKTPGKMQAVLKSVSAAQDYPAEAGPLLIGLAAEEWVVAVSERDKLSLAHCQELLREHGIVSTWTLQGEITVRLFDLERATRLIRDYREGLRSGSMRAIHSPRPLVLPIPDWTIQVALPVVLLAPMYAICIVFSTQGLLMSLEMPLLESPHVAAWFAICYFAGIELSALTMLIRSIRCRRETRKLAERATKEQGNETPT